MISYAEGNSLVRATSPSWNPLRITGTRLPPNLLLMAKIIALVFILSGQVSALPRPFLPFIPGLDQLGPPGLVRTLLQLIVAIAVAALLFNRCVRTSSFVVGAVILVAILSSRMYYQNNRMFAGLIMLLIGLYHPLIGLRLVRYQVVLMYFGATLNKLIEPDWRTGQFFAEWAATSSYHNLYSSVAHLLPGSSFFFLMGWTVILTEFAITSGLMVPRLRPFAIWLAVGYHTSLLLVAGRTFGLFWFALLASYLAFVDWPPLAGTVRFATRGFWYRAASVMRRLDAERAFEWVATAVSSIELSSLRGSERKGLTVVVFILSANPIVCLLAAAALAVLPEHRVRVAGVAVMGVLTLVALDFLFSHVRPRLRLPGSGGYKCVGALSRQDDSEHQTTIESDGLQSHPGPS